MIRFILVFLFFLEACFVSSRKLNKDDWRDSQPYIENPNDYIERNGDFIVSSGNNELDLKFYNEVFADNQQRPRVFIYNPWSRKDVDVKRFHGVYVLLDGEAKSPVRNGDPRLKKLLYIGMVNDPRARKFIYIPFLSLSFLERTASPLMLFKQTSSENKKYFAAYLASNCVSIRENFFDQLVTYAHEQNLGAVHALGSCTGSHPENRRITESKREKTKYMDEAVELFKDYKFVLAAENEIVPGYLTEKIVSPLLAGAIPIYWGSDAVLKFINPQSFVFLQNGGRVSESLDPIIKDSARMRQMQKSPRLLPESLVNFSWQKDIAKILKDNGKKTLIDELNQAVNDIGSD